MMMTMIIIQVPLAPLMTSDDVQAVPRYRQVIAGRRVWSSVEEEANGILYTIHIFLFIIS